MCVDRRGQAGRRRRRCDSNREQKENDTGSCNRGLRLAPRTSTALTHPTLLYHSRHDRRGCRAGRPGDRGREGRDRKAKASTRYACGPCCGLGRCGANGTHGGDKEWRYRDRVVDSAPVLKFRNCAFKVSTCARSPEGLISDPTTFAPSRARRRNGPKLGS